MVRASWNRFCLIFLLAQIPGILAAQDHSHLYHRPDILSVESKQHNDLTPEWPKLRRGHLEAVAQLLEFYPDREIYFLARDSELLYDLAKVMTQGDASTSRRLHLLNVSRLNMNSEYLPNYLAQEGISKKTLENGKKFLFVDTGFGGTIPNTIQRTFLFSKPDAFQTHLMASSNAEHPSTRAFLSGLNPLAATLPPGTLRGSVGTYEWLPHTHSRSNDFGVVDKKWVPITTLREDDDRLGRPEKAIPFMEDIRHYGESAEAKKLLQSLRGTYRGLYRKIQAGDQAGLVEDLKGLLAQAPEAGSIQESRVRDVIEIVQRNYPQSGIQVSSRDVGLPEIKDSEQSNRLLLMKKVPEWRAILRKPSMWVPRLLAQGEAGTLGAIADTIQDEDFMNLLAEELVSGKPNPAKKKLFTALAKKDDLQTIRALAWGFSQPGSEAFGEEYLESHIRKQKDIESLRALSVAFGMPHSAKWQAGLSALIQKTDDPEILTDLAIAFGEPHAAGWRKEFLQLLDKTNDPNTLRELALTFEQAHAALWDEEFDATLKKIQDPEVQKRLRASRQLPEIRAIRIMRCLEGL